MSDAVDVQLDGRDAIQNECTSVEGTLVNERAGMKGVGRQPRLRSCSSWEATIASAWPLIMRSPPRPREIRS